MNPPILRLENWLETPGVGALAKTLLHSLWEGAAVALALAMVLCVVRSPRARYAAACMAMAAMLAGLVVTFAQLVPAPPFHVQPAASGHLPLRASADVAPSVPLIETRPIVNLAWLVPFWIAGVLIFHLRALTSWMATRRLRHIGVCCAAEFWQERADHLQTRLRVNRSVALLESCLAEVPVVMGYVRPVILMPVGLLAGLPVGQVEAILLHELAHIRRYDYLVNLLQVFVEGLLFYHPAVWWISGVMRTERENCCDDLVVTITGGALEYASALTALETRREPRELLAATGGSLVNRIQRLLGRPERHYAAAMPVFTAAILTVTVVTAMAALQSGTAARRMDRPTAQMEVTPDLPVAPSATTTQPFVSTPPARPMLLAQAQPDAQTAPTLPPDQVLFNKAIQDIQNGNYAAARLTLNTLTNTYDKSEYLMRAKLAIADSWYREGGSHGVAQAAVEYRDFILFYPNTPEAGQAKLKLESIRLGVLKQELETPYKKWLDEDVVYIISDEERKAFKAVTDDQEREKFVEQFWLRRDPTPGTAENEFKEEIYRRIGYANAHFTDAQGVPGWRTDRGRIYIQYGPPDEIEAHASGGAYQRPASQGGGETEVFPFEQWRYRYIDGIGQNIIIEFVDKAMNGEYKMTMDPSEKDALLNVQRVAAPR